MAKILAAIGRGTAVPRRVALAALLTLAAGLAGCAWLEARQNLLALRPTPARASDPARYAAHFHPLDERLSLAVPETPTTPAGRLAFWWLPQPDPQAPALLYLHGTFRNLYQNLPKIDALRAAGFTILAIDYRGWGDSSAVVPDETTISADAALAWKELQRRQHDPARRVVYGHSLGGAVAVRLASGLHVGRDYGALVLESTFTTLPDVAAAAGFWGGVAAELTTLQFDARSRIGRVDAPILMLHGSADRTVPVSVGRALRDAAPPGVRWIEVPGGSHSRLHRDPAYLPALRELIGRLPPPSPALP
jgi:pimeloyl-ACP methyl ester carboxylesterase